MDAELIPLVWVIKSLLPRRSAWIRYRTSKKNSILSAATSAPLPPISSWVVKHTLRFGKVSRSWSATKIPLQSSAFNPHGSPDLI